MATEVLPLSERKLYMNFDRRQYTNEQLLHIYSSLLMPRMIEEKMLILLRQNKISKWFSGIGQEAVAVGTTLALSNDDYIFTLHRNLGVFTTRNVDLVRLFSQWQGKKNGFTKGRDRSFHFGAPEYKIIGMISHLGAMLGVADGISLASNLDNAHYISLAYSGDGGASEGEFHEALNTAAVWDLPVIFLIENNGYGLSTPSNEQFRCKQFIDKGIGYGMEAMQMDGNNILDVLDVTARAAHYARTMRRPVILEAITFRMRGHEEASGTKYVPEELMQQWALKDPLENYETWLLQIGILSIETIQAFRAEFRAKIEHALEVTFAQPEIIPDIQEELADVYAPAKPKNTIPPNVATARPLRFIDAVTEGLYESMKRNDKLVLMGQDIAEYGGVFKVTKGFVEEFGKGRVRNTPLCEAAILACGLGLSLRGYNSVVEMQFADFVSCGFNQIVNNLAKNHYRWGHAPNVVVRMPTGAGVAAGPFHSQSTEGWFFHVPGLKIVYPATSFEAKGLLIASIEDPNPVMFYEHKRLYRSVQDDVPTGYYSLPLGQAAVMAEGTDVTIVTYGWGVHWALEMRERFPNTSIEVVNLRTLLPWDKETVYNSIQKTGKCLVLHEATLTGGIGAEIAASVAEDLFTYLDAPVVRVASLDTPVPFAPSLENAFLPLTLLPQKLQKLIEY